MEGRAVGSVARAMALLDALAEGPAGVNALARRIGVNPSSASRLLATLESRRPGRARPRRPVPARAAPRRARRPRARAARRPRSRAGAAPRARGGDRRDRDAVGAGGRPRRHRRLHPRAGSVVSMARLGRPSIAHATATGKVLLAYTGEAPPSLEAYTERTITDPGAARARGRDRARAGLGGVRGRARAGPQRARRAGHGARRRARRDPRRCRARRGSPPSAGAPCCPRCWTPRRRSRAPSAADAPSCPAVDSFARLEPEAFWRHFAALTRLPRASGEEAQVVAHVQGWARRHDLAMRRDGAGNLVVRVPATAGRADAPVVVLQGHLDMVCEREPDSPYDPAHGRIHVVRDGDWIHAEGTTLGADNGVAIAAMMAVAEDGRAPHGPLELLMTVDEEVGLAGARGARPGAARRRPAAQPRQRGGRDADRRLRGRRRHGRPASTRRARRPTGPGCGWSPAAAAAGTRAATSRSAARTRSSCSARALRAAPELRIVAFDGGASRNAIPRDATAVVVAGDGRARGDRGRGRGDRRRATATPTPASGSRGAGRRPTRATTPGPRRQRAILDLIAATPGRPARHERRLPGRRRDELVARHRATDDDARAALALPQRERRSLPAVTNAIAAAARLAGAALELGRALPRLAARPRPPARSPRRARSTSACSARRRT